MLVEHYEPDKLFEEVVGYMPEMAAELVKIDAYLEDEKLFRMIKKDLSKVEEFLTGLRFDQRSKLGGITQKIGGECRPLQVPKWLYRSELRLIALNIGTEQASFSHFGLDPIFLNLHNSFHATRLSRDASLSSLRTYCRIPWWNYHLT